MAGLSNFPPTAVHPGAESPQCLRDGWVIPSMEEHGGEVAEHPSACGCLCTALLLRLVADAASAQPSP